jgi:hypothetical protein
MKLTVKYCILAGDLCLGGHLRLLLSCHLGTYSTLLFMWVQI